MSRKLTLALSGLAALAVVGSLATAASATVYNTKRTEKSYPVTVGKTTMLSHMVPVRETVHMRTAGPSSSGRYIESGKSRVWVTDAEATEAKPSRVTDTSESKTTQKGRFVLQGKAIVWVSE